ncbi:MAG: hypothetical protein RLO50_11085 [Azospirillaceae bacterium]
MNTTWRPLGAVFLLAALTWATGSVTTQAQTYCSEPLEPVCMTTLPESSDELQRTRCVQDVESYADAVDEYVECVRSNLDTWERDVRDDLQRFLCDHENLLVNRICEE